MSDRETQTVALAKAFDDYKGIAAYMRKFPRTDYVRFDYAVSHELALFMTEPEVGFDELERRADEILAALPAIKRIFAQPFIHLKDRDVILPVESVRIINNNTLTHIAAHSELWTDVKKDEIKPEKLLTRTYEDNYGIYENMVFCNVVDEVLSFARANIKLLREFIYANRTIEINILERVNHLNYFLALGKLHIGYSRSFDRYYAAVERCLNKLEFICAAITPRLDRPVYRFNKNRPAKLKLHKTNILSMHKEYHRVYKLAKSLELVCDRAQEKEPAVADIAALRSSYYDFCVALTVFAAGHFNFACDEKKIFDLSNIDLSFGFKGWTLGIRAVDAKGVRAFFVDCEKDRKYSVVLIPSIDGDKSAEKLVRAAVKADEYIVCSPSEERASGKITVDISSMESFRRIQQVILRAMIYSDETHDECPFCNNALTENADKSAAGERVYECASCRTEIHEARCELKHKSFRYTKIADFEPEPTDGDESWLAKRRAESVMYFRNITELDEHADIVCPHCGEVHK